MNLYNLMKETKSKIMESVAAESVDPTGGNNKEEMKLEELIIKNQKLSEQIDEYKRQFAYMVAELENNRKIYRKDIDNAKDYSICSFATDMLQVLENLDRAISSIPESAVNSENISGLYTGILLTKKEILNIFSRYGISKIHSEGKKFDHKFHHAVKTVSDANKENDLIVEVLQDGYTIKDRLLRPSMVVIVANE